MQAGGKPSSIISEKAQIADSWGDALDILYFADSLGNMDGIEVERIIKALREHWSGTMGIHTHDNMGKGLDNSIVSMHNGRRMARFNHYRDGAWSWQHSN